MYDLLDKLNKRNSSLGMSGESFGLESKLNIFVSAPRIGQAAGPLAVPTESGQLWLYRPNKVKPTP